MTVNRTVVPIGVVTLLLAAGVLAGKGVVTQKLTASSAHDGVRWQGLRLDAHWQRTALAVWTNALLTDPLHSSVVWAGTNVGVWRSSDGGTTWHRAATVLRGTPIVSLGATTTGDMVIAGGDDGTVYRGAGCESAFAAVFGVRPAVVSTQDGGRSWRPDVWT